MADVNPEDSIRLAFLTAVIVASSTGVAPIAKGLASAKDRCAWVSVMPGMTNRPPTSRTSMPFSAAGASAAGPAY